MHDPLSVLFRVRLWPHGPELCTVWHNDPCRGGSDDSCRHARRRLTTEERSQLKLLAGEEARKPWIKAERAKEITRPADAEALMRGAVLQVAHVIGVKLTMDEATRFACVRVHGRLGGWRGSLCHLPGWHTASTDDSEYLREDAAFGFYASIAESLHPIRWWTSPLFHVHHWKITSHHAKRWIWFCRDRCSRCSRRYTLRDIRTEGAVTYFWESSAHRSCLDAARASDLREGAA